MWLRKALEVLIHSIKKLELSGVSIYLLLVQTLLVSWGSHTKTASKDIIMK